VLLLTLRRNALEGAGYVSSWTRLHLASYGWGAGTYLLARTWVYFGGDYTQAGTPVTSITLLPRPFD
jgi:hypothetical protein